MGSMHSIGGSIHSLDMLDYAVSFHDDLSFEEMNVADNSRRSSCGTEMAILAVSSPGIKALNLPKTPTFPEQFFPGHRRNNSNDTFASSTCSSISTSTHESRKTGTIAPLLASMGSVEESPTRPNIVGQDLMQIYVGGGTQDLVDTFQNHNLITSLGLSSSHGDSTKENTHQEKENLHPNFLQARTLNGRKKVSVSHRASSTRQTSLTHQQRLPKGSYQIRRPSHRRGSFDALPSPAEIGGASKVDRRVERDSFPFLPSDVDNAGERDRHRSGYRRTQRAQPKSMSLTTGFR